MKCEKISIIKKQICIGDMLHQIGIFKRDLTESETDSMDATERFIRVASPWAAVKSIKGEQFFDETNIAIDVTHEWYIRYIPGIDINHFIQYKNQWYKILDVDNSEERDITTIIKTAVRGSITKPVNEA